MIAQARNHEPFEFFGYSDKSWDYEGASLVPVTGDFELAPGLWLFETPGHTVGHYSLLVGEKLLFAFDVTYTPTPAPLNSPLTDAVMTMWPPRPAPIMEGTKVRTALIVPPRFTPRAKSQSS